MAALITLALNPLNLFTIGFQLSYAATLAIIYLQPPLAELARNLGLPKFIRPILTVTLAAQIGVLPLCAYYFQHIPLGALLFNLVLLPLMSPVVGLGLGGALLGLILPVAASALMFPCLLLLEFILFITGLARHPLFYRPVYPPGGGLVLIYGLLVAAAALYYRYRSAGGWKRVFNSSPAEPGYAAAKPLFNTNKPESFSPQIAFVCFGALSCCYGAPFCFRPAHPAWRSPSSMWARGGGPWWRHVGQLSLSTGGNSYRGDPGEQARWCCFHICGDRGSSD